MRLLEDSALEKWRDLLVESCLALTLIRDSTSVSGGDVGTFFRSNRLAAFVNLSTASLIAAICGVLTPFWSCLHGELCRALVSFGRV